MCPPGQRASAQGPAPTGTPAPATWPQGQKERGQALKRPQRGPAGQGEAGSGEPASFTSLVPTGQASPVALIHLFLIHFAHLALCFATGWEDSRIFVKRAKPMSRYMTRGRNTHRVIGRGSWGWGDAQLGPPQSPLESQYQFPSSGAWRLGILSLREAQGALPSGCSASQFPEGNGSRVQVQRENFLKLWKRLGLRYLLI